MNILLLNWRDPWHPGAGGAEVVTYEHAKRWVRAGHRVTWVTGGYQEQNKHDVTVEGVHFSRFGGSLTIHLMIPIYVLLHAKNYDVVVDEIHGIPFFSPLFTKKPVVAFIHEVAGVIWDYMYPFPINKIGKTFESWCYRLYRTCLFWTDAPSTIDELVQEGILREKCIAIPCPIVKNVTVKSVMKEKNPTYLFVSRIVRMKGIEEVIKAFSFIVKEQKQAHLGIIGTGESKYIQQLKQMIDEYGVKKNVTFYGKIDEKRKYELMAKAHLLLHASVKEGWGLVVLEAASVGTPSVVYDVPGLKDVVKDGVTGKVLETNSPFEMAKQAMHLLKSINEYQQYQANGLAWVSSLHWENVARTSLQLLKKAVLPK